MKSYLPHIHWQAATVPPKLDKDEVHIWRADLNLNDAQLFDLWKVLDKDEQRRADRFKFAIHRQRFIAGKGILRKILSKYLKIPAEKILFCYSKQGKPFLDPKLHSSLAFNNSASTDLALYAVTLDKAVGIDVEHEDKTVDYVGVVERFFSANENKSFQQLSDAQQKAAFFYGWIQKEAFVKAIGTGLSFHLHKFDVNLVPDRPAKLIAIDNDEQAAKNWHLVAFEPKPNFVGCLAVEGKIKNLNYLSYESSHYS